jgi:hypothetical protein
MDRVVLCMLMTADGFFMRFLTRLGGRSKPRPYGV